MKYFYRVCLLILFAVCLLTGLVFNGYDSTGVQIFTQENTNQDANTAELQHITSAIFSSYRLVTPLHLITNGSIIHVVIETFNGNQQRMTSGGDYWHAVMGTQQPYQASTAGRIVDYNNGTYSVYFYAAWSGHAQINITLVHPSIAVHQYLDTRMWQYGPKVFWDASFVNFKRPISNFNKYPSRNYQRIMQSKKWMHTICWVTSKESKANATCEYPPARDALGNYTFVCRAPDDGICRPLDFIAVNNEQTVAHTMKSAGKLSKYFDSRFFRQRLARGPVNIIISGNKQKKSESNLNSFSHGYWTKYTWTSFLYKDKWTNATHMRECLRNKNLFLLGDSTSRQWAQQIPHLLQLSHSLSKVEWKDFFFENTYTQLSFTVKLRFHPHFITNTKIPFHIYRYFADIIDSISVTECKNTILMISPWAHFPQWTRDSLMQRYVKIKEAVVRLRTRCPNIPVIVKGGHVREHHWEPYAKFGWSDYTLKEISEMFRTVFSDVAIWYLDVWDMNLSYPSQKSVHMPTTVVEEELKLAISYLCNRT